MELEGPSSSSSSSTSTVHLAFLDSRRLGRLRLVPQPVSSHPPVSALGFDPVLNMPDFDEFLGLLKKKKGTVKGVIMDQAFSAGVGNWVADEILYQARIHPACPIPSLSGDDLKRLHHQIRDIPMTAVAVNAEHKRFPEDWLFRWRWGKGKKQERRVEKAREDGRVKVEMVQERVIKIEEEGALQGTGADSEGEGEGEGDSEEEGGVKGIQPKGKEFMALPNGKPATITFIEVGGRTTAVVTELQKMPEGVEIKPKISKGGKGSRGGKNSKKDDDGNEDGSKRGGSSPLSSNVEETTEIVSPARVKTGPRVASEAETKANGRAGKRAVMAVKDEPVEAEDGRPSTSVASTKIDKATSRGRGKRKAREEVHGHGDIDESDRSLLVSPTKKSRKTKVSGTAKPSTGTKHSPSPPLEVKVENTPKLSSSRTTKAKEKAGAKTKKAKQTEGGRVDTLAVTGGRAKAKGGRGRQLRAVSGSSGLSDAPAEN